MHNLLPIFTSLVLMLTPLDTDVITELKNDHFALTTVCKVTRSGNLYVYLYSMKNTGKTPVKVRWVTLNKALNNGDDVEMMWDIEPGEMLNFTLEHPDPPRATGGYVYANTLATQKDYNKAIKSIQLPKEVKINVPKAKYYITSMDYASGVLPQSYILNRPYMPRAR